MPQSCGVKNVAAKFSLYVMQLHCPVQAGLVVWSGPNHQVDSDGGGGSGEDVVLIADVAPLIPLFLSRDQRRLLPSHSWANDS